MNRIVLVLVALLGCLVSPTFAENPWDAACRVRVGMNGGSGTLIDVQGDTAIVLTVKHVATRRGKLCVCTWGEDNTVNGRVLDVSRRSDLALLRVDTPPGVVPVPVALPSDKTGPFVLAGFPGYDRQNLRFQVGDFVELSRSTLTVSCRPEPGMSGGPTFDKYGRVVGAVSAYGIDAGYSGSGQDLIDLVSRHVKPSK